MSVKSLVPLNLLSATADPATPTPVAGDAYWNSTTRTVRVYTGSAWVAMGGIFDFDTNTPLGTPRNGVYRIRHGFDNFLSNASMEYWLLGTTVAPTAWTLAGDATIARSATPSTGTYSAAITFGTGNTGELYQAIPTSQLVDYTFSCYVQRTAGTGQARLVAQDAGSPYSEFAAYVLPTGGGWQLATLTVKPTAGTSMRFAIKSGDAVASTWLVDECMFEESKGVATTFTAAPLDDTNGRDVYGQMSMRGGVINLPTPVNPLDAATKQYADLLRELVQAHGATGATETFDATTATVHTATLDANCAFTFAGAVNGLATSMTLILTQDATGSRLATWPTGAKFPGGTDVVLSTAAGAIDIISCLTIDGGTTWYIFAAGQAMAI